MGCAHRDYINVVVLLLHQHLVAIYNVYARLCDLFDLAALQVVYSVLFLYSDIFYSCFNSNLFNAESRSEVFVVECIICAVK